MPHVLSLCENQFLKNHNIRQKFNILLILTGKNASELLEWHVFRVQGMPNPIACVASLYNKQFLKNHSFRRHIAENGRGIGLLGGVGGVGGCYGGIRVYGCHVCIGGLPGNLGTQELEGV